MHSSQDQSKQYLLYNYMKLSVILNFLWLLFFISNIDETKEDKCVDFFKA
jgi:hypothetical protein